MSALTSQTSHVSRKEDNESAMSRVHLNGGSSRVASQTNAAIVEEGDGCLRSDHLQVTGPKRKTHKRGVFGCLTRIIFLDIPLMTLFAAAVLAHSLSYVYNEYITQILAAADWRHTGRLQDEITYYDRWCDVSDITSFSMNDFIVSSDKGADDIFDTMMVHGLSIFPSILSTNTTASLRKFVMRRNKEMTPAEAIPLDGEYNRWSFAIGANEDPVVSTALGEVATNSKLRSTLEKLLGPNPAVVEITSITSAFGAEHQGMHSDVKALGNSVKYSRTFTHSYSLFIGLQDTTEEMGATQICPGTHYCANDLSDECSQYGFTVAKDGPWRAGDAMLMNQCMWHRGTEHTDPEAQHRVVLIVTFISRPRFGIDNRQLSHGTYFHIRYDMWGHTLNDLLDTRKYMSKPFTVLRSSGIWKPSTRQWGWDWLTVASLRIANEENGYTFEDLHQWIHDRNALGLPHFLRGPVSDENGGWSAFIEGTMEKITVWTRKANMAVLVAYIVLLFLFTVLMRRNGGGLQFIKSSVKRLLFTHGSIAIIGCLLVFEVSKSGWAETIKSGRLLARPFPDPIALHTAANVGPTTVPEKADVLIGCRFDSRDLAAYDNFLDYHPGNRAWLTVVTTIANAFSSFMELPPGFRHALVDRVVEETSINEGRFLLQNSFGDWVVLAREGSREHTLREIIKTSNPLVRALDREIAYMLADCRFGLMLRGTRMQKLAEFSLEQWRDWLFLGTEDQLDYDGTSEVFKPESKQVAPAFMKIRSLAVLPLNAVDRNFTPRRQSMSLPSEDRDILEQGDDIEIGWESGGRWLRGTILGVERGGFYVQYLEDGERDFVPDFSVRRYTGPLQEGDRVEAEYEGDGWFLGTTRYVYADRRVDVDFDDGDKSFGLDGMYVRRVLENKES